MNQNLGKMSMEEAPVNSSESTQNRNSAEKSTGNGNCCMALLGNIGAAVVQILYQMNIKKTITAERNEEEADGSEGSPRSLIDTRKSYRGHLRMMRWLTSDNLLDAGANQS